MATPVDMAGNQLIVESLYTGATAPGQAGTAVSGVSAADQTFTGQKAFTDGIRTKQAVTQVNDTTPTKAELTTAFGDPATIGRGFIGTVDDNDGNTNGYLVFASDADFFFLKFTKAT
jgi:hypothetical protein